MLLALATLVVAGLASAQDEREARARQQQLRGRLGLLAPVEKIPVFWKRLRWIVANRDPFAVGLVFAALKTTNQLIYADQDFFKGDPAIGKVIDWLIAQTEQRLVAGELPWPGREVTELATTMESLEGELGDYAVGFGDPRDLVGEALRIRAERGDSVYSSATELGDMPHEVQVITRGIRSLWPLFDPWAEAEAHISARLDRGGLQLHLDDDSLGWNVTATVPMFMKSWTSPGLRTALGRGRCTLQIPEFYADETPLTHYTVSESFEHYPEEWPFGELPTQEYLADLIETTHSEAQEVAIRLARDLEMLGARRWQLLVRMNVIPMHFGHLLDMVRAGAFPDLGSRDLDEVLLAVLQDEVRIVANGVAEELGYVVTFDDELADDQEHQVVTFPDGAEIIEIIGTEALAREGSLMKHCIGQPKHGHPQKLEEGRTRAFSYRDPTGKPRATVTVWKRPPWFLTDEIQGPHNSTIHDKDARERLAVLLVLLRGRSLQSGDLLLAFSPADKQRLNVLDYAGDTTFDRVLALQGLLGTLLQETPSEIWNLTGQSLEDGPS